MNKNITIDGVEYTVDIDKALKDGYLNRNHKRSVGQVYYSKDGKAWLLVNLGCGVEFNGGDVVLIGLRGEANRYMNSVTVKDRRNISDNEWSHITADDLFVWAADEFNDLFNNVDESA